MSHDPRQSLDDLAARLERERVDADRKYNDALTELDRVLTKDMPTLPPLPTESGLHPAATRALIELTNRQYSELIRFQNRLILFLQKITGLVDTKDRAAGAAELRGEVAQLRAKSLELARDIQSLRERAAAAPSPTAAAPAGSTQASAPSERPRSIEHSADYVGFEDQFRGSEAAIRARVSDYVPLFAGATNVVDVGCGRGELLALFNEAGIDATGVDLNPSMVAACKERGLKAVAGDAVAFLEAQPDASLGGLIAIQVVEHLEPKLLTAFLSAAFAKLTPGAPIVLETINGACVLAFFETYIRDLTHARPLHPDTLRFLVQSAGFQNADVRFRAPVREEDRLPRVAAQPDPRMQELANAINAHADRLNSFVFSSMDFAVVARR
jgi:O-antigen chain-terminating methyltransferase